MQNFITELSYELLTDKIYDLLMSNEDFGLGEMGVCRDESERVVNEWLKESNTLRIEKENI